MVGRAIGLGRIHWSFLLAKIRFGSKSYDLPGNRIIRIPLGICLVLLGTVGFLPVLGFWMIPLGLMIHSVDIPVVRRFNRRVSVAFARWWSGRKPRRAQ